MATKHIHAEDDKKNKTTGWVITGIVHVIVIALLMLTYTVTSGDGGGDGIAIDFGSTPIAAVGDDENAGSPDAEELDPKPSKPQVTPTPPTPRPTPTPSTPNKTVTTEDPESVRIKKEAKEKAEKETREKAEREAKEQAERDEAQKAKDAFKKGLGGGSKGSTPGAKPGSVGDPSGTPGGGKGKGMGTVTGNLAGRGIKNRCETDFDPDEKGKVGVKVWVDKSGRVTRTEARQKDSNITLTSELRAAVEKCAKSYQFSPSGDAEEQTGTIIFEFGYSN